MLFHSIQGAGGFSQAIAFQASSTSSGTGITLPSGLTSKDLLILFDFAYDDSSSFPTYVLPSGWTAIANQTDTYAGDGTRAVTSYRVGSAGLSGTTVTGMAAPTGGGVRKICVVFRNAAYSSVGTNTYDASSGTATGSLTAGTVPYIALAFVSGGGTASLPTVPSGGSYTPASSGVVFCYYTINGGAGTYTTDEPEGPAALKLLTLNVTNI